MIAKLESAGLGFYVRTSHIQERLGLCYTKVSGADLHVTISSTGKIPLRHLVYRVLELLPSMRSLVYDFGQLNSKTETDYVVQIVKNHVSCGTIQFFCLYWASF